MARGADTPKQLVHEAVMLRADGASFTAVARKLGVGRRTVARIANDRVVEIYRLGLINGAKKATGAESVGTSGPVSS